MFERFTPAAPAVGQSTTGWNAIGLGHNYIGTEHLLLALVARGGAGRRRAADRTGRDTRRGRARDPVRCSRRT